MPSAVDEGCNLSISGLAACAFDHDVVISSASVGTDLSSRAVMTHEEIHRQTEFVGEGIILDGSNDSCAVITGPRDAIVCRPNPAGDGSVCVHLSTAELMAVAVSGAVMANADPVNCGSGGAMTTRACTGDAYWGIWEDGEQEELFSREMIAGYIHAARENHNIDPFFAEVRAHKPLGVWYALFQLIGMGDVTTDTIEQAGWANLGLINYTLRFNGDEPYSLLITRSNDTPANMCNEWMNLK